MAAYLNLHYEAYWSRTDVDSAVEHAGLIHNADRENQKVATAIKPYEFEGITEITILAPDHPRLLSMIAGACAAAGANIVDAMVFTTTDGRALDTILINREFDEDHDERRRANRNCRSAGTGSQGRNPLATSGQAKGKS